mmetsp:Transcript_19963/g.46461  ORF Transcript_19963/g.46461 Transcript_19963/m.46461 type:complete len:142 (+) Transcript_19963:129-554(+)
MAWISTWTPTRLVELGMKFSSMPAIKSCSSSNSNDMRCASSTSSTRKRKAASRNRSVTGTALSAIPRPGLASRGRKGTDHKPSHNAYNIRCFGAGHHPEHRSEQLSSSCRGGLSQQELDMLSVNELDAAPPAIMCRASLSL